MKTKELRKKTDKELLELKEDLKFQSMRASSAWGVNTAKNKEAGINTKGTAKQGEKTSIQKQLRRTIAQINTILNERKRLHKSKIK